MVKNRDFFFDFVNSEVILFYPYTILSLYNPINTLFKALSINWIQICKDTNGKIRKTDFTYSSVVPKMVPEAAQ